MADNLSLVISGLTLTNPYVGQGVYATRLLQALARRVDVDTTVIIPTGVEKPADLGALTFQELPAIRLPKNELLKSAILSERLLRYVTRRFPDSIFHSPGPLAGLARPRKLVITLHDCLYRRFPNYHGRFYLRRFLAYAAERYAARADLVLTDSEFSRNDLISQARLSPATLEVLSPWVDRSYLQKPSTESLSALGQRLALPERYWLYVGGYDYRKNVEFLLDAYAEAARRTSLPQLVLVGTLPTAANPATCNVETALIRNNLTPSSVLKLGAVTADNLRLLYHAASLLIFPSLGEGFGLPPAEAIAAGCPVLVSKVTSLPEVVRNSDSFFDPYDRASLVAKLLAAEKDESSFKSDLSPRFTEDYGLERYLALIRKVAAR